jgi:aminoglycoside 6'-N-acetyltransferase I
MKINIRAATPQDRDDWIRLRYELWPDCPPDRHRLEVAQVLRSRGTVALAFVGDQLVGFAELSIRADQVDGTENSPVPYLEGWYVVPAYQGRGLGRSLLSFVEKWAVARGYGELASDAELRNRRGIQLHRRLGFREVSKTAHFVKRLKR